MNNISAKFIRDIYNKGNSKDFIKRNKYFLILSSLILVLAFVSGFTNNTYYLNNINMDYMMNNSYTDSFVEVFSSELYLSLTIIISGLLISIPSILTSVSSTVGIGYSLSSGNYTMVMIVYAFIDIILKVFTLTCAFLITKMEIRFINGILSKKNNEKLFKRIKTPFKDLIYSFTIVLILLILISAISFLFL